MYCPVSPLNEHSIILFIPDIEVNLQTIFILDEIRLTKVEQDAVTRTFTNNLFILINIAKKKKYERALSLRNYRIKIGIRKQML